MSRVKEKRSISSVLAYVIVAGLRSLPITARTKKASWTPSSGPSRSLEEVIFDDGKVAVKGGFGAHAKKQAGYTKISSHYGFEALFCNPAEGHEKGFVEGLIGWIRRNILVPVPAWTPLQN